MEEKNKQVIYKFMKWHFEYCLKLYCRIVKLQANDFTDLFKEGIFGATVHQPILQKCEHIHYL